MFVEPMFAERSFCVKYFERARFERARLQALSHPLGRMPTMAALMNPSLDHPGFDPGVDELPVVAVEAGVYRRRRLLAAVLMAVLAYGAWSLALDVGDRLFTGEAGADSGVGDAAEVWVVQPGDTLWSIAVELGGDVDVRQRVDELADANGGPMLEVGQRLEIPPG